MRIGIEASSMLVPAKTGIQQYVTSLILAMTQVLGECSDLHLFLYFHNGDKHADAPLLAQYAARLKQAKLREWRLQRGYRLALPIMAAADRLDLLHMPTPNYLRFSPCPVLMTFHDASWACLPEDGRQIEGVHAKALTEKAVAMSSAFIAVSESAKQDLVKWCGVNPQKVLVVHHGVDSMFWQGADGQAAREKYHLGRYILHVGALQYRKNLVRLLQAYAHLRSMRATPQSLVLVGPKGWGHEDVYDTIERLVLGNHVRLLGYVPQQDMPGLYSGAEVFVYPSLYEGFGMPVLEAMACGTVVVASNRSSIPEVAGDAAIYFDPYDVEGLAAILQRALTDESLRTQVRQAGLQRAAQFTWTDAAYRTVLAYREVVDTVGPMVPRPNDT